jgi:hypothetical protein
LIEGQIKYSLVLVSAFTAAAENEERDRKEEEGDNFVSSDTRPN